MAKFCENCGSPLKEGFKFCENCGAPVKESVPEAAPSAAPSDSATSAASVSNTDTADSRDGADGAKAAAAASNTVTDPAGSVDTGISAAGAAIAASAMHNRTADTDDPGAAPQEKQAPPYHGPLEIPVREGAGPKYQPDEDWKSMFLRYDNRLNRKRYNLRSLALSGIYFVIKLVVYLLCAMLNIPSLEMLFNLFLVVFLISSFMLTIRRLHDLNRPGWWCLGTFIPLVNLVLAVYVIFFKGTDGPNDYGPDPLEV